MPIENSKTLASLQRLGGGRRRRRSMRRMEERPMSTFAAFGMTRTVAVTEARKKTATVRDNKDAPGGRESIPMDEWVELVERRADKIMEGGQVRQLSQLLDSPQFAQEFIDLARRTDKCRDMRIKARCVLKDALGEPIVDPKSGAPRYGFIEWVPARGPTTSTGSSGG